MVVLVELDLQKPQQIFLSLLLLLFDHGASVEGVCISEEDFSFSFCLSWSHHIEENLFVVAQFFLLLSL